MSFLSKPTYYSTVYPLGGQGKGTKTEFKEVHLATYSHLWNHGEEEVGN